MINDQQLKYYVHNGHEMKEWIHIALMENMQFKSTLEHIKRAYASIT